MMLARWRLRDIRWKAQYRALLFALTLLRWITFVAAAIALLAHRAHDRLSRQGEELAEVLGAHPFPYDEPPLARVINLADLRTEES